MTPPPYDERTALLIVDIQNDFADPNGGLYVAGGEDVVTIANREAERAREAGALVVYTRDWHPPDTPHFERFGGLWPVHCVRETWGAEFHPDLKVDGEIIHKATSPEDGYSAFSVQHLPSGEVRSTGLEQLLWERGIERIVILGLATDYCVREADSTPDAGASTPRYWSTRSGRWTEKPVTVTGPCGNWPPRVSGCGRGRD